MRSSLVINFSLSLGLLSLGCNSSSFTSPAKPNSATNRDSANGSASGDQQGGVDSGDPNSNSSDDNRNEDNDSGSGSDSPKNLTTKPESDSDGYVVGIDSFAESAVALKAPRFGMLVNDLRCAFCHLEVKGNVSSVGNVDTWNIDAVNSQLGDNAHGTLSPSVLGSWFLTGKFSRTVGNQTVPITVNGGIKESYVGKEIPTKDGTPAFPTADFDDIRNKVTGKLTGKNQKGETITVKKVYDGNLVILGTKSTPITILGDVLVTGDLVIKGTYTGLGSIYVQGKVYIPANLIAKNSVFPFPNGQSDALSKAEDLVKQRTGDALGIATPNSIFIAQLSTPLYDDPRSPPHAMRGPAGVDEIYSWYPGGKTSYEKLYEAGVTCDTAIKDSTRSPASFNLIEAFLYAANAIGGISHAGSWAINGGIMADSIHIIGAAGRYSQTAPTSDCRPAKVSPVHKLPMNRNFVNYDYRLQRGLRILSHITTDMK